MDKLNLPVMGERTWFDKLTRAFNDLDGRFVNDGFNRDFVLSNGLSLPNNGDNGDFGINHFRIGDFNILFGWGIIHLDAKANQSGVIALPVSGASWRAVVSEAYTFDGGKIAVVDDNEKLFVTPQNDINSTFQLSIILVWGQI